MAAVGDRAPARLPAGRRRAPTKPSRAGLAFRDGLRTFPVALGALVVWALVTAAVPDADRGPVAPGLRLVGAGASWGLAALALPLVRRVLGHRHVPQREAAARRIVLGYGPVALLLVVLPVDPGVLAVMLAALAMTAPGVLTVVLDGSDPGRAALRVVGAVALVPLAVVAGVVAGYAGFALGVLAVAGVEAVIPGELSNRATDVLAGVAFGLGAFPAGFLAGHLTTYVPLALGAARDAGVPRRPVGPLPDPPRLRRRAG